MLPLQDLAIASNGKHTYVSGADDSVYSGVGDAWLCDENGVATRLDETSSAYSVEVDPTGKYRYASESVGGDTAIGNVIWRYTLDPNTGLTVGQKTLYFDYEKYDKPSNSTSKE
jgi:hypothetical protein